MYFDKVRITRHALDTILEIFEDLNAGTEKVIRVLQSPDHVLYGTLTSRFVAVNLRVGDCNL